MSMATAPLPSLGASGHLALGRRGGGALTWAAATVVSAGMFAAAIAKGSGEMFWASALCTLLVGVFALRPDLGIMGVLLARPSLDVFHDRQFASLASLNLNPASALGVLLVVVGGAFVIERWRHVQAAPAIWPFLAFATIALIGIAVAPSKGGAGTEWLRLFSIVITYAITYAVVRSRRDLHRMVAVVLLSAAPPVGLAVWQIARGGSREIDNFDRATGTFLHPNPFAIFLAVVILLGIPLLLCKRLSWRLALWVACPMAGVALIGSYTRTAWVGIAFGLLVVAALRYRSILVLGPLALVLVVAAVPAISHRFADLSTGRTPYGAGNSLATRIDLWRENLPKVKQKPIIGHGLKAIEETDRTGDHVHSDYVRALVETGVLGFAAFLWLFWATGRGCLQGFRSMAQDGDPLARATALGSLTAFAAWVLMSGDSNLMTQVAVAGTAWAVFAVGHAASRLGDTVQSADVR